jgi:hypothetical protein
MATAVGVGTVGERVPPLLLLLVPFLLLLMLLLLLLLLLMLLLLLVAVMAVAVAVVVVQAAGLELPLLLGLELPRLVLLLLLLLLVERETLSDLLTIALLLVKSYEKGRAELRRILTSGLTRQKLDFKFARNRPEAR